MRESFFLRQLVQDAHSSDPTRLVSAALQDHESAQGDRIAISIEDPIADDLDVLAIMNISAGIRIPRGCRFRSIGPQSTISRSS